MQDSDWPEWLEESGLKDAEEITADFQWSLGSAGGDFTLGIGETETGISLDAGVLGITASIEGVITEDTLLARLPMLGDEVYSHNFTGEKSQPLFEELFGKRTAENIDQILQNIAKLHWQHTGQELTPAAIRAELKTCRFKKAEEETFTIDNAEVSCQGYQGDASELFEGYGTICVYLYKNQLAAIRLTGEEHQYELRFLGGTERTQKMELAVDKTYTLLFKAEKDSSPLRAKFIYSDENGTRISFQAEAAGTGIEAELLAASIKGRDSKISGTVTIVPGAEIPQIEEEGTDFEEMPGIQAEILKKIAEQIRYFQNLTH